MIFTRSEGGVRTLVLTPRATFETRLSAQKRGSRPPFGSNRSSQQVKNHCQPEAETKRQPSFHQIVQNFHYLKE